MKVIRKQRNSKMCIICGLDNEYGLRAPFYDMEDGSVMTIFRYRTQHQSYPGRVHGGLITAMLDEMGLRALWAERQCEEQFGVTVSLETKYRKPVPYDTDLFGRGKVIKESGNFFTVQSEILGKDGNVLASGTVNYMKLSVSRIADGVDAHEEMCYLIEDDIKEIL